MNIKNVHSFPWLELLTQHADLKTQFDSKHMTSGEISFVYISKWAFLFIRNVVYSNIHRESLGSDAEYEAPYTVNRFVCLYAQQLIV